MCGVEAGAFGFSVESNGWRVGRFAALADLSNVAHLVTTLHGPDTRMIARHPAKAAGEIAQAMGLEAIAFADQVHGAEVVAVDRGGPAGPCDAMVTRLASLGLMGRSADCPLVLAADRRGRAVGVAHASWRGTVQRIAAMAVGRMAEQFAVPPSELVACICPSAGPCCYEVGTDVLDAAVASIGPGARDFFVPRGRRFHFDLWRANRRQLLEAGVREENIHVAGICTICGGDDGERLFPSHRAGATGRFAAVIGLRSG